MSRVPREVCGVIILCYSNPQRDTTTVQQKPIVNESRKKRVLYLPCVLRQLQQWFINCRAGKCSATVAVLLGALVCIVFVEGLSFAATPRSGRFLDRLLRSAEVTPQLISVPVPRPATASERRASQQKKRLSVPTEEEKQPVVSADIYSWESFIRFAE